MIRRLPWLLALLFCLLVLGLASQKSLLLALMIPILIYVGVAIYAAPQKVQVEVHREVDFDPLQAEENIPTAPGEEGDARQHSRPAAGIRAIITNTGDALEEVVVEEQLPSGFTLLEGPTTALLRLSPGESYTLAYRIQAVRGEYRSYSLFLNAYESCGLFRKDLESMVPFYLASKPVYTPMRPLKVRPPQTRGFAGPLAARNGGTGICFFTVREYQAGDAQRQVNWRLSARSEDRIFTNVFEQERVADIGLILDARWQSHIVSRQGALFEYGVSAANSLAESFLREGNRVSLLVYGSLEPYVYPGYGKMQLERIRQALTRVTPVLNYALENLNELPIRMFPSGSQIVMISPLLPDDLGTLAAIRSHGYAVLVISPNPFDFEDELAGAEMANGVEYAWRIARAERAFLAQRLRNNGVHFVDWHVHQPLEAAIHQSQFAAVSSRQSILRYSHGGQS